MLGECFSLLEHRGTAVTLPGCGPSGEPIRLRLPEDLYVIGTMNLIDQSVEQLDFALRRRFLWLKCPFDDKALLRVVEQKWNATPKTRIDWERVESDFRRLATAATELNHVIECSPLLGPQYQVGHTYFFDVVAFLKQVIGESPKKTVFLWNGKGKDQPPLRSLWELSLEPLLREYLAGLSSDEQERELNNLRKAFLTRPDDEE